MVLLVVILFAAPYALIQQRIAKPVLSTAADSIRPATLSGHGIRINVIDAARGAREKGHIKLRQSKEADEYCTSVTCHR